MTTKEKTRRLVVLLLAVGAGLSCSGHNSIGGRRQASRNGPLPLPGTPVLTTDSANGVTPGSIPASFAVSTDGAATYSIPLWVSPGRAGMQPALSFDYSSHSVGDGLLGYGWSLGGLARITRCQKTIALDGYAEQVRFDNSDPLCLDGERLLLVGGVHMQANAEYRTERDRFARVRITTADDSGPRSFEIDFADGKIATFDIILTNVRLQITPQPDVNFGAPGPNTILSDNNLVRYSWAVRQIQDRAGNTVDVFYSVVAPSVTQGVQVVTPESLLPDHIDYTGSTAGAPELRSVKFFYQTDENLGGHYADFGYVAGFPWSNDHRIEHIEMWGPNPTTPALLRQYKLAYSAPSITGRLLISSIQAIDQFGVSLGATSFGWEAGSVQFASTDLGISDFASADASRWVEAIDVNGDGKTDLLYIPQQGGSESPTYFVRFSNGTGYGAPVDTHLAKAASGVPPVAINIDGDTRADLFVGQTAGQCAMRNTTVNNQPSFAAVKCVGWATVGDLNGDGLTDLLGYDPNDATQWKWYLSHLGAPAGIYYDRFTAVTAGPIPIPDWWYAIPNRPELDVVDIDGAGAQSLLGLDQASPSWMPLYTRTSAWGVTGPGAGTLKIPTGPGSLYGGQISGGFEWLDVNGDGLTDLVTEDNFQALFNASIQGDARTFQVVLNTGAGFADHNGVSNAPGSNQFFSSQAGEDILAGYQYMDTGQRAFDYDADGRMDLLVRPGYGGPSQGDCSFYFLQPYVTVLRSTGTGFQSAANFTSTIPNPIIPPIPSDCTGLGITHDIGLVQPVDVNGDGLDDVVVYDSGSLHLFTHQGKRPDALNQITDGYGAVTAITYKPISDLSVYSAGTNCQYPSVCLNSRLWVVSESTTSNGNGGVNTLDHQYADARADLRGRGFLGVSSHTVTHVESGVINTTTYDLRSYRDQSFYPFIGLPATETSVAPLDTGKIYTHSVVTRNVPHIDEQTKVYFTFPQTVDETETETTGNTTATVRTIHTVQDVDDFGDIISSQQSTGDGEVVTATAQYQNDTVSWLIRRATFESTTHTTHNLATQTRTRAFTYDQFGEVYQDITEPGQKTGNTWAPRDNSAPGDDGVQTLYVTFVRSATDGQVTRITQDTSMSTSTPSLDQRSLDLVYAAPDQVFLDSATDALMHKTRFAVHPGLGEVIASDDDNGVLTTSLVDGFGRVRHEATDGDDTRDLSYLPRAGSPSLLELTELTGSGSSHVVDFDVLGRQILSTSVTRNDRQAVSVDTQYDPFGRGVKAVSQPHFNTQTPVFSSLDYDNLGRVRFVHQTDGSQAERQYAGLNVSKFDPLRNQTTEVYDQSGRVRGTFEVATNPSHVISTAYDYGPFGMPSAITDTNSNVMAIVGDRLGRRIHLSDPDMGQRDYTYTAFGELHTETIDAGSADPELTTYLYDNSGRMREIDNRDGTTTYQWDTATNGNGLIDFAISPDGIKVQNFYDPTARLQDTKWTLGPDSFDVQRGYDLFGRLGSLTYPAVSGRAAFAVTLNYAGAGDLLNIVDQAAPPMSTPLYAVLETDAAGAATNPSGQFPQEQFANGLTTRRTEDPAHLGFPKRIETLDAMNNPVQRIDLHFNSNGNLDSRNDLVTGSTESFGYDSSNRLKTWSWSVGGVSRNVTFGYDDLGNFRSRTVMEDASKNVTYNYDGTNGAGPHGVTAMNGLPYSYKRGRQLSGPGRTVNYTAFDLPSTLTSGNGDTDYKYDAFHARFSKQSPNGDQFITVGGLYERRTEGGEVQHIFTVPGLVGVAAQRVWTQVGGSFMPDETHYLHADHLGSPDTITDGNGFVERLKYDPFGGRVSPTRLDTPVASSSAGVRQGFTGHEHDDELSLINMRGRIYDPALGRFLTGDPIISNPFWGQGLNRYTYARNNPLTFVDPSGFDEEGFWGSPTAEVLRELLGHPADSAAGVAYATLQSWSPLGITPGGSLVEKNASPAFLFAKSLANIAWGHFFILEGTSGGAAGGAASLTGVGTAVGVPVAVLGAAVATHGVALVGQGIGSLADSIHLAKAKSSGSSNGKSGSSGGNPTGVKASQPLATTNSAGKPYPKVVDPRTGNYIPTPPRGLKVVENLANRAPWDNYLRGQYIKEWYDRGFSTPKGGWEIYDIHHIISREYGGSNDFWNLVPVIREIHQNEFNSWWSGYEL